MRTLMRTSTMWSLAGALALTCLSSNVTPAQTQDAQLRAVISRLPANPPIPAGIAAAKAALAARDQKIDPALLLLSDQVRAAGAGNLEGAAKSLGVLADDRRVMVMLHADSENDVDDVEDDVRDLGGQVQTSFESTVFALVPPAAIERLGSIPDLYYAAPQPLLKMDQASARGTVRSDGVDVSKVQHLHQAGITGQGIKVGILDFGFQGLSALIARGELPQPKAVRAFGAPSVENGVVHGTACAEIVNDMAPGAELYLASVGNGGSAGNGDIVAAAQWLAEQKVDVISFSGGGHFGPHNGTSLLDRLVDSLVAQNGLLWVNAAGNEADEHWGGTVRDSNRDGILEINDKGEWAIAFAPMQQDFQLLINWDDWGSSPNTPSSTEDIDAVLFEASPNGDLKPVAQSIQPQRGRGTPIEVISYKARSADQVLVLALVARNVTRPINLHVYRFTSAVMVPKTARGSIGIPATARGAVSVAAVNVRKGALEPYSGQGPTDDGRMKPDVAAADDTISIAYRDDRNPEGRFPGTSAACPHVSGYAALLKQAYRTTTVNRLREVVIQNVRDMGPQGPDNQFGSGHIDGTRVAASPSDTGGGSGGGSGGGGGASMVDGVPDAFGSPRLRASVLERLWEMARDAGDRDDLRVVTGNPSYRMRDGSRDGDGLKVGIRSDRACNYMLVHRSSNGTFSVLAPDGGDARLRAGERYALPDGETWEVTPPAGRDGLMVVCSSRTVDLESWIRNPNQDVWFATVTYTVTR